MVKPPYEPGTVMLCAPDDEQGLEDAKRFCKENDFNPSDVKIARPLNDKIIVVKVK